MYRYWPNSHRSLSALRTLLTVILLLGSATSLLVVAPAALAQNGGSEGAENGGSDGGSGGGGESEGAGSDASSGSSSSEVPAGSTDTSDTSAETSTESSTESTSDASDATGDPDASGGEETGDTSGADGEASANGDSSESTEGGDGDNAEAGDGGENGDASGDSGADSGAGSGDASGGDSAEGGQDGESEAETGDGAQGESENEGEAESESESESENGGDGANGGGESGNESESESEHGNDSAEIAERGRDPVDGRDAVSEAIELSQALVSERLRYVGVDPNSLGINEFRSVSLLEFDPGLPETLFLVQCPCSTNNDGGFCSNYGTATQCGRLGTDTNDDNEFAKRLVVPTKTVVSQMNELLVLRGMPVRTYTDLSAADFSAAETRQILISSLSDMIINPPSDNGTRSKLRSH